MTWIVIQKSTLHSNIWFHQSNEVLALFVTGASGYVGTTVADQFIQAGYVIVGTSRTASKAEALKKFVDIKYGAGKFEIYEIGNIAKEGVFDNAVKGNVLICM